jgi:ribosomal protein S25
MELRSEPTQGAPATASVVAALRHVRRRARGLLVTRKVSVLVGAALSVAALGAVLDYLVLLPQWLRVMLWLAGAGSLGWAFMKFVLPAWRFQPELREVALRLERSPEGRAAGLEGVLTSGLELAETSAGAAPAERWMASRVVEQAMGAFAGVRPAAILAPGAARTRLAMVGVLLIGLTVLWAARPALTTTGALRILAPWTDASWPKRTELADATGTRVHPLGSALLLRAALTRTDLPPGKTSVAVRYRVFDGGTAGPVRRLLMTSQGRLISIPGEGDAPQRSGERFDRLIEPSGLAPGVETDDEQPRELEYWFETADDSTAPQRVLLVQPPAIAGASGEVQPPEYAAASAGSGIVSGTVDLGPGNDDRAVLGPVLAGSRVRLTINFNKPVPGPAGRDAEALGNWAMRTFGAPELGAAIETTTDGEWADSVTLALEAGESLRLPVIVSDDHGLTNTEEAVYTLEVVKDLAPTATVVEPQQDESVLATAAIGIEGEGRDDAGLRWVALERQWSRPPAGSIGATAEALGGPVEFARQDAPGAPPLQARAAATLDLRTADIKLLPGDEVWVFALAQDTYSIGGQVHEAVRSAPRKLRIVSEDQFVEQLRGQLAQVRETAKVLDAEQASVSGMLEEQGATPEAQARQGALTDRLASGSRAVQELIDRSGRNNLADESLAALMAEARRLSASAAQASGSAAQAMNSPDPSLPEPQKEAAQDQQETVRDELGRLIDLLDRGQDAWMARRDLQRLLEDQKALAAQTRQATDSMIGKAQQDLTPSEQASLAAIAQRQRELAERAEQAIDELSDKSEEIAEKDAVQADAMQQAADRGQRENVPATMDEAAESAEQNRGQQAQSQQQEAVESLEEMLEDLDNAAKNRDEALRRILASLVDTLRGLVRRQTDELRALAAATEGGVFDGLDGAMIRLNQNTLAAAGEVRAGGMAELGPIADLLDRADEAQVEAIEGLRARPVDAAQARAGEEASLARLREALAEAEKQKQDADQRENDRKRRELKAAYKEVLESQVALREETATYVDRELTRKQMVSVRRLGERQAEIRASLADLLERTEELAEAGVFQFAHKRLDEVAGAAAERLGDGVADRKSTALQDSAVRVLQSLLGSLEDPKPRTEEEFREGQEAGGGQGGASQPNPVIPEMAELLLLRALQQEAADMTRLIDDAGAPAEEVESIGELQHDLAEQGRELIERLQRQANPDAAVPEGEAPAGEPGEAEAEEEGEAGGEPDAEEGS